MMSAERGAAKNTLAIYTNTLERYLNYLMDENTSPSKAETASVENYLRHLTREGLSASTQAMHLSSIRQFHKFLFAEGIRTDDPCSTVDSPKLGRPLPKVMSIEEVDQLIGLAEQEANDKKGTPAKRLRAARLYVLIEMLYASGLRVSELVSLPKTAANASGRFLTIVGKGNKERIVPLSDKCKSISSKVKHRPLRQTSFCKRFKRTGITCGTRCRKNFTPRHAPRLRQSPPAKRRRLAFRSTIVRTCGYLHNADLYACIG